MSSDRIRIAYHTVTAILILQGPRLLYGQVLPPDAVVAGMSVAEWGVLESKWVGETPADTNPIADTTGEFSFLGGPRIRFLFGWDLWRADRYEKCYYSRRPIRLCGPTADRLDSRRAHTD